MYAEDFFKFKEQEVIEQDLESGSTNKMVKALFSAVVSIDDFDYLLEMFAEYTVSDDLDVADAAIQCLGYLSRYFPQEMVDRKGEVLEILNNENIDLEEFGDLIEDVKEEIETFTKN